VEEVKWKKPSRPSGVPVWSHSGLVCVGEALKSAVRLTFPKGASLKDPAKLFDARLDSTTVRAIDVHEGDTVKEAALRALTAEAITLNTAKAGKYVKFWKPGSDLSHQTGLCRRSGDDERSDILV
jgi:hypothetical protein